MILSFLEWSKQQPQTVMFEAVFFYSIFSDFWLRCNNLSRLKEITMVIIGFFVDFVSLWQKFLNDDFVKSHKNDG
jgi:hypothetical protein